MPLMPCFKCNPNNIGHGEPGCEICNGKGLMFVGAAGDFHAYTTGRAPVQIATGGGGFVALANDGTIWRRKLDANSGRWGWEELDPLPQPEREPHAQAL